ncbi:MAG TPA: CehA/McbA family metallohydrolase [Kofleriaceae bacterium]
MKALAVACVLAACGRSTPPISTTTLSIRVTDHGALVGARVLLFDAAGNALHIGKIDMYGARQSSAACEFSPGVIGTWDGIVLGYGSGDVPIGADRCAPTPAIPYGKYKVWAWRGIEYEKWEGEVDLSANRGKVELAIALDRAWQPGDALAADLHVHAHASDDSTMPDEQRVAAQVAAGIRVIGLSNHNTNGDASAAIHALHLDSVVASLPSNEVTSEAMHANMYPALGPAPPAAQIISADPAHVMALMRAQPGHPIIQINHPRFRYQSLFDTTHWDGTTWPPPFPTDFDAVEVVPGYAAFNAPGDRRLDDGLRDFYTLIDHGKLVAPVGGSDSHDFNWVLDGAARTYVFAPFYDQTTFVDAIRARRTVATDGPWLDVKASQAQGEPSVGPGEHVVPRAGAIWLDISLSTTKWQRVDRIRVQVGAQTQTIPVTPGRTFHWAGAIEVGAASDTFVGVAADGDSAMPLEFTGTYQRDKWKRPGDTPFCVISPILIDADGDGRWKRGDGDYLLTPLGSKTQ